MGQNNGLVNNRNVIEYKKKWPDLHNDDRNTYRRPARNLENLYNS